MHFNQQIERRIVVAVLIRRDDEYLFCWKSPDPNRNTHINQWQMIGGGVDNGESLEVAIKREVREEIGLDIKNINFISRSNTIVSNYKGTGKPRHIFYEEALADYDGGEFQLSDELEKTIWLKPEEFHLYPLNPETVRFLNTVGLYPKLPNLHTGLNFS